jgi:hypothetical protein
MKPKHAKCSNSSDAVRAVSSPLNEKGKAHFIAWLLPSLRHPDDEYAFPSDEGFPLKRASSLRLFSASGKREK